MSSRQDRAMGITRKYIRNPKDSPTRVQDENDCMSEPFTKPRLSSKMVNKIKITLVPTETFLQKENITLDTYKHIIRDLVIHLDRVTTKVFVNSTACNVIDDLGLQECEVFVVRWSEELRNLRSEYRSHLDKISNVEKFRRNLDVCLETREDQVQKEFQWFINILKSLPKSSVCQDGYARIELLNLYRQWKKGRLISMLPIMDFIMKTLLEEKSSILKRKLQHNQLKWKEKEKHFIIWREITLRIGLPGVNMIHTGIVQRKAERKTILHIQQRLKYVMARKAVSHNPE